MNGIIKVFSQMNPKVGEFGICRLGQHSFLLKLGETLLAFDPYCSEDPLRLIPPVLRAEELRGAHLIFCSHDHGDHLDRPSLRMMSEASPEALFCVPEAVRPAVLEIPQARMRGMNAGDVFEKDGITVRALAAAHEFLDRTAEGLYPYLGYVVSGNGVTVYHTGDCCCYDGLLAAVRQCSPDVVLLPINGRDAERYARGCIGNMTMQEAVDLAGMSGAELAIPAHYDMFAGNTADPADFTAYAAVKYPHLRTRILKPGEVVLERIGR